MKKNLLLILAAYLLFPIFVKAQALYADTTFTGYYANLGANADLIDDIQLPTSSLGTFDTVDITKVNIGIYRTANAPAVTIKMYYTLVNDTSTIKATAPIVPPKLIGTFNLAANGSSPVLQVLSAGDSINTLFGVPKFLDYPYPGYQTFFLGVSMSNSATKNDPNSGWASTTGSFTNDDFVWVYNNGKLQSGNFASQPVATFYAQVYGKPGVILPVRFLSFNGVLQNNEAVLTWSTASEINNKGFEIERSTDAQNFTDIGFAAGNGTTESISNYTFSDPKLVSGNNYYRLKQIGFDGTISYSSVINLQFSKFDWSILGNPSNNSWLQLQLDKQHNVSVQIVSVAGTVLQTINKGNLEQGTYSIPIDMSRAASGMYIVRLMVDGKSFSKEMVK